MIPAHLEVLEMMCVAAPGARPLAVGQVLPLTAEGIGFGRLPAPQACFHGTVWYELYADWVGRHHSAVLFEEGRWVAAHSGTTNPTTLNGEPIDYRAPLSDGDLIGVAAIHGKTAVTLRFRATPA